MYLREACLHAENHMCSMGYSRPGMLWCPRKLVTEAEGSRGDDSVQDHGSAKNVSSGVGVLT